MTEYRVVVSNAPYFYYVTKDGKISLKARQGNLAVGRKVSGTVAGALLINIHSGLSGEQPPPYAMYLTALELVDESIPDPEPEPEPEPTPDTITYEVGVWQMVNKETGERYENIVPVTFRKSFG